MSTETPRTDRPQSSEVVAAGQLGRATAEMAYRIARDAVDIPGTSDMRFTDAIVLAVAYLQLDAEVDSLRETLQAAQEDATAARTDGYADALRWVIADLEANQACSAYEFIRDFRARLSAIENGVERP